MPGLVDKGRFSGIWIFIAEFTHGSKDKLKDTIKKSCLVSGMVLQAGVLQSVL